MMQGTMGRTYTSVSCSMPIGKHQTLQNDYWDFDFTFQKGVQNKNQTKPWKKFRSCVLYKDVL